MSDYISRQAVIDKINERQRKLIYCFGFENDMVKIMNIAKSIIIAIPSVQPERKRGRWVDGWSSRFDGTIHWFRECSVCGYGREDDNPEKDTNFCPDCGADMREETDNGRFD